MQNCTVTLRPNADHGLLILEVSRSHTKRRTTVGRRGKYEFRPAVKKLNQLRPDVSASCVSVASRVVNPKHDKLHPAISKEVYQFHRKRWVYKMSSNWKVLYSVLLYFILYTIIRTHTELLNHTDSTVVISCYCLMFKPY